MKTFLIATLLCVLCTPALAADGSPCSIDTFYSQGDRDCVIMMDGRVNGGSADSAPIPMASKQYRTVVYAFGRCPENCEPGTIDIYECATASLTGRSCGKIASLTGCGAAFNSVIDPRRPPLPFIYADMGTIADAQCVDDVTYDGVDVLAIGIK